MKRKMSLVSILAGLLLLVGMQTSVFAIPMLAIDDPATVGLDVLVVDNGLGDANPLLGAVTYIGAAGPTWFLNVSTGVTKPAVGTALQPYMDLNSINSSNKGGTLDIQFTETNFGPFPGGAAEMLVGGATTGTADFEYYFDPLNIAFNKNFLVGQLGPFGGAFSGTTFGVMGPAVLYSLTLDADITHNGAGLTSFNASMLVPEAGSLMLLGFGLVSMAFYRGRFRKF